MKDVKNTHPVLRYYEMAEAAYQQKKYRALAVILDAWEDAGVTELNGWMYADTVHAIHTFRGLVALDNGNVEAAKLELIKSAKVKSGITISTVGPNMKLAKRLLEIGERKIVLRFLKSCRSFWLLPFRFRRMGEWTRQIAAGAVPDFSRHI